MNGMLNIQKIRDINRQLFKKCRNVPGTHWSEFLMIWPPRLPISFYDLKDSLWYRPALMTIAALILSLLTVQLDIYLFRDQGIELPWLFQGGSDGARGVLTAISGTMITVATTAFSITLVAMQLGSSQFSPRILRSFTGDTGNQMVLGIFIATFAYSLSVLRTVRSETDNFDGFVPTVSVTVAVVLAFTAIGSLIFFFHHATRTIQASVVIDRTYTDLRNLVERTHTRQGSDNHRLLSQEMSLPERYERLLVVKSDGAGYLRDPDISRATSIGASNQVLLEFTVKVGEYLNPGVPIATIWRDTQEESGERESLGNIADDVRGCFNFGMERTLEFDSPFGLQQLTDISLLALSPGTNDPTTAHSVIDRLGSALINAEQISGKQVACADHEGTVRLLYPIPTFEDFVRLPFDQLRHYGAADPLIVAHMLKTLQQVAHQAAPENALIVQQIALEAYEGADRSKWLPADTHRVRKAAAWALDDHVPPNGARPGNG